MSEDFEKHIKSQRAKLDQIEQADELLIWQGVQQSLKKQEPPKRLWSYRRFAAAASILFLFGYGLAYLTFPSPEKTTPMHLTKLVPELEKEENRYIQLITEKEKAIQLDRVDSTKYADIFNDLALLESIHREYRKDIPQVGPKEQLIQTLVKYYEQKIRILERLSREIEINENYHEKNRQEQRI